MLKPLIDTKCVYIVVEEGVSVGEGWEVVGRTKNEKCSDVLTFEFVSQTCIM